MIQIIANGIETGNPLAYLILFVMVYPPCLLIILALIDKIRKQAKK